MVFPIIIVNWLSVESLAILVGVGALAGFLASIHV
jgi:hypothetical protein